MSYIITQAVGFVKWFVGFLGVPNTSPTLSPTLQTVENQRVGKICWVCGLNPTGHPFKPETRPTAQPPADPPLYQHFLHFWAKPNKPNKN